MWRTVSLAAYLFLSISIVLAGSTFTRKVTTEFLCEDTKNDAKDNVVYSKALGQDDALHYILSTVGVPTIMVFHTPPGSHPTVDCARLLSHNASSVENSITFSQLPFYTYAVMFTKLYEYNDVDDKASLTLASKNESDWQVYDLSDLDWDSANDTSNIRLNQVEFRLSKNGTLNFHEDGYLSFKLRLSNITDRGSVLPHLEFSANSSLVDFILNDVQPSFPSSRFALEMTMVTSNKSAGRQTLTNYRSMDDEHSPGVFEVVDWVASGDLKASSAYLQWKSVCYKEGDRSVQTSTAVMKYDLEATNATTNMTVALAYFGDKLLTPGTFLVMRATNVSFGLSRDHFYTSTNYSAWSFTVGYGFPPQEHISTLIILVMSLGLGLPVLLMLVGGIYMCVRRQASASLNDADLTSSYQQIN